MPQTKASKSQIYFFYGEDTYSISEKLRLWIEQFKLKHDESNIEVIEGKTIDLKEFATNLNSMPFLSDKRLIIVKNFLEEASSEVQKEMVEILENPVPEFCILVFTENVPPDRRTSLFKKLASISNTEEFEPPSPPELTAWISDEVKARGGEIARPEADFLGFQVGPNLWQISNEINKLISASENKPITKKLILDLVTPSLSSSIFKLTDAIAAKDRADALRVFKILCESGEDIMMIFYMIVRHFRILIQVKYLMDQGTDPRSIAKELKLHPFVTSNATKQSQNFQAETLKKIYSFLLEIDKNFKSGKIKISAEDNRELLLEIERFIIKTCNS